MTTTPAAADAALVKCLARLDLSGVQQRYDRAEGAELIHHVVSNMGLEYRRFLLLRVTHPDRDIAAPPLIDTYWRWHAADQAAFDADCAALATVAASSADRVVPPAEPADGTPDPTLRELYATTFP
ncbi:MAG: hypothetical protein ACRDUV_20045 [Pseudonocardiaceae bacterium]